ncbi:uroporphyrinogen-III synthase-like [Physella acuta]|uniref:uroporphyrinogen-III synthase-like n=1 Tax=Physella acuta TaxID=109671 RepID=UPI0027DEAA7E|nr:uroporphyrinogen-III synthase-like [Physella acuta]XP_059172358.1 uroporphyrinogen-III synthase-like [Physella acuta]
MGDEDNNGNQLSQKRKSVFLFKSQKENDVDLYKATLEKAGFSCVSLPVLSFTFVNQSTLKSYLKTIHMFSAIIFTSVRAVESVANLIKELDDVETLCKTRAFVVGKTTAEAARKANFKPEGENTGNAEALAEYILQDTCDKSKLMLYPCSNIRRDTLKEILTKYGIPITEVTAYETCLNEDLKLSLQKSLGEQGIPDYAVFFSPSGFQNTKRIVDNDILPLDKVKILTLGPATDKAVRDMGYLPFGMAEKPDPESLLQLLL